MINQTDIKIAYELITDDIAEKVDRKIAKRFSTSTERTSIRNDSPVYFPIGIAAKYLNVSRPKLGGLLSDGILPYYQIKGGSSKKWVLKTDLDNVRQRVDIPRKTTDFISFELEFKHALKKGKELKDLYDAFCTTENEINEKYFIEYLWDQGYTDCFRTIHLEFNTKK
ncbi:MAG: hypothetical protein COC22_01325 [Flavobacteriaceae bacterium]|nr:MAG: hypothetical protein COC22_01325 [Flavobacteriaceae bacterium]